MVLWGISCLLLLKIVFAFVCEDKEDVDIVVDGVGGVLYSFVLPLFVLV